MNPSRSLTHRSLVRSTRFASALALAALVALPACSGSKLDPGTSESAATADAGGASATPNSSDTPFETPSTGTDSTGSDPVVGGDNDTPNTPSDEDAGAEPSADDAGAPVDAGRGNGGNGNGNGNGNGGGSGNGNGTGGGNGGGTGGGAATDAGSDDACPAGAQREAEPNNDKNAATPVVAGVVCGAVGGNGDGNDFLKFTFPKNARFTWSVTSSAGIEGSQEATADSATVRLRPGASGRSSYVLTFEVK